MREICTLLVSCLDRSLGTANPKRTEENNMTAIILTRVDECRHMARYYKLDIKPTLFGECSLVRRWRRIGRAGTVRIETYSSQGPT